MTITTSVGMTEITKRHWQERGGEIIVALLSRLFGNGMANMHVLSPNRDWPFKTHPLEATIHAEPSRVDSTHNEHIYGTTSYTQTHHSQKSIPLSKQVGFSIRILPNLILPLHI